MDNANKHIEKAKDYAANDCAYIHAELKRGKCEIVVGGDMRAIERSSEISGIPYEAIIISMEKYRQAIEDIKEEDLNNAREC